MKEDNQNFTLEAGRLLCFVGRVATAIRMNSPYSGFYNADDPSHAADVMWLADCLHEYERLGAALQESNLPAIEEACNGLLYSYKEYERSNSHYKSQPAPTFERQSLFTLSEGCEILTAIRDKARFFLSKNNCYQAEIEQPVLSPIRLRQLGQYGFRLVYVGSDDPQAAIEQYRRDNIDGLSDAELSRLSDNMATARVTTLDKLR